MINISFDTKLLVLTSLLLLNILIFLYNTKTNQINKDDTKTNQINKDDDDIETNQINKDDTKTNQINKDDDDIDIEYIIETVGNNLHYDNIFWEYNNCSISDEAEKITDVLSSSQYFNSESCKVEINETTSDSSESECEHFTFYNPGAALALLDRKVIHAVGDSITRRLVTHLYDYLMELPFTDRPRHAYKEFKVERNSSVVHIYFHWAPSTASKIKTIHEITEIFSMGDIIFVGQPNHDFSYETGNPKKFYRNFKLFNQTLSILNSRGAYIVLDGILNFDESRHNTFELEAAHMFYDSLYRKQNLFGYIDMWAWIQLETRKMCVLRDYTGIHFVNDDIRLLHMQAFLNYVQFFHKANNYLERKK